MCSVFLIDHKPLFFSFTIQNYMIYSLLVPPAGAVIFENISITLVPDFIYSHTALSNLQSFRENLCHFLKTIMGLDILSLEY